ncbi:MAG TPA: hypothetical protein VI818_00700 [Candidatus Thermoplasmatota archaeon]|nr:hypothetical protein [Candidatus Thermoplasmatota archaeon]
MKTPTTNPVGLMKACGLFLLIGSALLIAGFLVHPAESPDAETARATVASHATMARASHQLLFAGLLAIAIATPLGGFASVQLGAPPAAIAGALIAGIGALVALPLVAIEATVVPAAAEAGDAAAFEAWSALGSAFLPGFLLLALGLGIHAFSEARTMTGAFRTISYAASGLAGVALVGWIGAYYAGIWSLNVLGIAILGVFAYTGFGSAMELFGGGHTKPAATPTSP